jgi:hypothetical protein
MKDSFEEPQADSTMESKYPTINDNELTMYLDIAHNLSCNAPDCPGHKNLVKDRELEREYFSKFLETIEPVLHHNTAFQMYFYMWKQVIHSHDRTTALMMAFSTGLLFGQWMTKPELMPAIDEKSIEKSEHIM